MNIYNRVLCDFALFISAVIFPWWVAAAAGVYFFFRFSGYYELIFLGLFLDLLYGISAGPGTVNRPIVFIIAFLLYIILSGFKKYLRFYV